MALLLITGVTGHVGSAVLLAALRAGYTVRAAVRSQAKANAVLARPAVQALALAPGRLTFALVPDITVPGAFDTAAESATHIIHIASPLVTGDCVPLAQHHTYFIRPAVRGTLELLGAANRAGTVRRVVITSSIVALVPADQMEGKGPSPTRPVQPTDRIPFDEGPYESEFAAYAASKVAALAHAEAFVEQERPAFDVVYLHPSFVLGRNEGGELLRGTNSMLLALLLGKRFGPYASTTVHVDDVAKAHVAALDYSVPGGQSYILSRPARWNDAKEIVKRRFPSAVESRLLVGTGNIDSVELPVDASLTEQIFGFRHAPFEDQVTSVVGQFLESRARNRGAKVASGQGRAAAREALPQVSANA